MNRVPVLKSESYKNGISDVKDVVSSIFFIAFFLGPYFSVDLVQVQSQGKENSLTFNYTCIHATHIHT